MSKQTTNITKELALDELNEWLDFHDVESEDRIKSEEGIDPLKSLTSAIMAGRLIINADKTLTYTLKHPVRDNEDNIVLAEVNLKNRLTSYDAEPFLKGIKATNQIGMVDGHLFALCDAAKGLIKKMDMKEMNTLRSVVGFFL